MTPAPNAARPFIFLEKTALLLDQPLNVDPARLRFAAGWTLAMERLCQAGFALAVMSNESGLAFGYYDERALEALQRQVATRFTSRGLALAGFLYCPHHPQGTVAQFAQLCDCRFRGSGLFKRAANELGADLARSWLIAISPDALHAARSVGCRTILVDSGHEPELLVPRRHAQPYDVAPDLSTAAALAIAEHHADAAA